MDGRGGSQLYRKWELFMTGRLKPPKEPLLPQVCSHPDTIIKDWQPRSFSVPPFRGKASGLAGNGSLDDHPWFRACKLSSHILRKMLPFRFHLSYLARLGGWGWISPYEYRTPVSVETHYLKLGLVSKKKKGGKKSWGQQSPHPQPIEDKNHPPTLPPMPP